MGCYNPVWPGSRRKSRRPLPGQPGSAAACPSADPCIRRDRSPAPGCENVAQQWTADDGNTADAGREGCNGPGRRSRRAGRDLDTGETAPGWRRVGVRASTRVAGDRDDRGRVRPLHKRRVRARRRRAAIRDARIRRRRSRWPRWRRPARPTSIARCPPRAPPTSRSGARCRAPSGPSTCTGSPGSCRSGPVSSRSWRAWTTASRSGSRATSTSRWRPRISSTTRAGRTSLSTPGSAPRPGRSGWPVR